MTNTGWSLITEKVNIHHKASAEKVREISDDNSTRDLPSSWISSPLPEIGTRMSACSKESCDECLSSSADSMKKGRRGRSLTTAVWICPRWSGRTRRTWWVQPCTVLSRRGFQISHRRHWWLGIKIYEHIRMFEHLAFLKPQLLFSGDLILSLKPMPRVHIIVLSPL